MAFCQRSGWRPSGAQVARSGLTCAMARVGWFDRFGRSTREVIGNSSDRQGATALAASFQAAENIAETVPGACRMRRICYSVAMSLDGYVSGPNGERDWIVMDPDIDFAAMMSRFDTILMGRRTYEAAQAMSGEAGGAPMPGSNLVVFSRTLKPSDHPQVTIVGSDFEQYLRQLRGQQGKSIWLFGGSTLFGSLLEAGFVDEVEVAVIPVLLGGGTPLLKATPSRVSLKLLIGRTYHKTGTVALEYAVQSAQPMAKVQDSREEDVHASSNAG